MSNEPIDLSKTEEFAIEEARHRELTPQEIHEHPPQAEIEISWSDGTLTYLTVSDKTADRIARLIEKEVGRQFTTANDIDI